METDRIELREVLIWVLSFIEIFLFGLILLLLEKNIILLMAIVVLFFLALCGATLIRLIYGRRNGN